MDDAQAAEVDVRVVPTSRPSAENLLDFQRYMRELDKAGREDEFWSLGRAVFEVVLTGA